MAAVADKLTHSEFQSGYGRVERSYEYWHGEARPKAMPTCVSRLGWTGAALVVSPELTTIEVSRIWDELDRRLHR